MTQPAPALRITPLNQAHRRLGAKMIDFGGWEMPVQYSSVLEEHHAVRRRVGLFDVSHMGEIEIRGPEALKLTDHVATNAVSKLKNGQAHYSALLYEHGGFVDDILVHKVSPTHVFVCVNASNQDKDFELISSHNKFDATVTNTGGEYAQLAIQGPHALGTLRKLTSTDLTSIGYYHFLNGDISGVPARIARTGYTGEDGFEIYIAPAEAMRLWDKILEAGAEFGILPCGLAARNTLRLEAKMALYGHEITASITPWEADLAWIVNLAKGDFIGRDALVAQKEHGLTRKLIGFEMVGRGIGRDGYEVYVDGVPAGWVTSGGPAPTLTKNIGLCYLPVAHAQIGRIIQIMIRGQPVDAVTIPTPFYKRGKK